MVPPLTLCAYMKKGPNLRWSLIQCSGGDEGDRTPDLLTASQALSQLSYAPVRRSTIRELPRRCKDIFGKTFRGRRLRSPAGSRRRWPAPAGGRRCRRPPFQHPQDISGSAVRRYSFSECGPPCAGLPFHRRRAHYWVRSRFRPPGHFKTMPDYGARPGTTEHAGISANKTAGRRLVHFVKCRAWTAGLG